MSKFYLSGDCHGDFSRLAALPKEKSAVLILGDAGFNFWLNKSDNKRKNDVTKTYPYLTFYCLRGNHEARPQDITAMRCTYNEDIQGMTYWQDEWPNIHYLMDYEKYTICGHKVGVIGGAYSVDKFYRLERKIPWFSNEQLSEQEREECLNFFRDEDIDIMMTHTCPISWEPRDLFLGCVNQSTVDKTMEIFLEEIKNNLFDWRLWIFGHYHADRLERPHVEQFYKNIEDIDTLWYRWYGPHPTIQDEWWLQKSEMYYAEEGGK